MPDEPDFDAAMLAAWSASVAPDPDDEGARWGRLAKLREAFPASVVGKLPKVTCKACSDSREKHCDRHERKDCSVCSNWISTAHIHIDYVGHAEVTDRLLSADPLWNWEPMACDADGLPLIRKGASGEWTLWIRLTVCGVTRPGVGSVSNGFDAEKQLIGDALRNASMRFGVALGLWSKAELESSLEDAPITGPPAGPSPAQQARSAFFARIKALPEPRVEAFKAWLASEKMPTLASEFSDLQLVAAQRWAEAAEAEVRAEAAAPPPAAESDESGPEKPAAPNGPAEAPGPLSGAEEQRLAEAGAAPSGHESSQPELDRLGQAIAHVQGLNSAEVMAELGRRHSAGWAAPRKDDSRRLMLAELLASDPEWEPPANQRTLV